MNSISKTLTVSHVALGRVNFVDELVTIEYTPAGQGSVAGDPRGTARST
ncbi:hypothetical protein ACXWTF_12710 [Thiomicrolovo sp. ZZH C-3]